MILIFKLFLIIIPLFTCAKAAGSGEQIQYDGTSNVRSQSSYPSTNGYIPANSLPVSRNVQVDFPRSGSNTSPASSTEPSTSSITRYSSTNTPITKSSTTPPNSQISTSNSTSSSSTLSTPASTVTTAIPPSLYVTPGPYPQQPYPYPPAPYPYPPAPYPYQPYYPPLNYYPPSPYYPPFYPPFYPYPPTSPNDSDSTSTTITPSSSTTKPNDSLTTTTTASFSSTSPASTESSLVTSTTPTSTSTTITIPPGICPPQPSITTPANDVSTLTTSTETMSTSTPAKDDATSTSTTSTNTPKETTSTTPKSTSTNTTTTKTPPPRTSTPPVSTTSKPTNPNSDCGKTNSLNAVPGECDTYVECKDGASKKHYCPDGLVFKPSTKSSDYPCVLPSDYKCTNGSIKQKTQSTDLCPHRNGNFLKKDSDCSQYVVCNAGRPTIMHCAQGLVFNVEKATCDWPANVPSCKSEAFKDFECPAVEADDSDTDEIFKYSYKNNCKKYVACQGGHPRLLSCDQGLHFSEYEQTCIDKDKVTDCVD